MTTTERKATELSQLIAAYRIVKVNMQSEHAVCVARVDMPEFGIHQGDQFHLFASSYVGYAYIVTNDGCTCKSYEFSHGTCKHTRQASAFTVARYFAMNSERGISLEPVMREDDVVAHVEDDLRTGAFEIRYSCPCCGGDTKRKVGRCGRCEDFAA